MTELFCHTWYENLGPQEENWMYEACVAAQLARLFIGPRLPDDSPF
jgi:hypothetical protein